MGGLGLFPHAPHAQSLGHSDGEGSVYVRKEKDVPSSPSLGTRKAEGSTRCPSVPWDRAECLQERSPAQQRSDKSGTPAARCLPVCENKKPAIVEASHNVLTLSKIYETNTCIAESETLLGFILF